MARQIWQWSESRNIWLVASYIASKDNVVADSESRSSDVDTEWCLSRTAFATVTKKFGYPDIDLFASYSNKKCKLYCSWKRDPGAVSIDTYKISWGSMYFYAFPPFALILRILQKIILDDAIGILIVPNWPSQPWFPLFSKLLIRDPIILKPNDGLLFLPFSQARHPLARDLFLVAGLVSGKACDEKGRPKNP